MIRCFIAVDLDPKVSASICRTITQLKQISSLRWVPPANFHLTIKFLGAIEQSQIDPLAVALDEQLRPFPRFSINAKGLGVFPDSRRPKILWVGFAGNQLLRLAHQAETVLQPLGYVPEIRPFKPHLTIGRWRHFERPPNALGAELMKWRDCEFGESFIDKVILYQSVLKPEGASYQTLKAVSLNEQPSD
ncbi:MAG: RNA 2',3'-cyclic phosphodiesterase [Candidatus Binatia bacterium]